MSAPMDAKVRIIADTKQAVAGVKELGKELGAMPASAAAAGKGFDEAGAKVEKAQKRFTDAAYRLALVRPQITDIVTGLATGQNPFTILLQQGGQLGDVFGGFGNALKAVGEVLTPMRLLLGGVAAAMGTVAYQAFAGAEESTALRKSLALTGNAAGTSAGQLDALARASAAANKSTIGDARESLAEIVASGRFTSASIGSVNNAVLALGKLNGQASSENLKLFTALADGVLAGAVKLNAQFNFLTADQVRLIRTLEAQGRTQEAVKLITDNFAETLQSRAVPALGLFERAWFAVKEQTSKVLDNLKAIGRDTTAEDKLAALEKRLANVQQFGVGGGRRRSTNEAQQAEIQAEIAAARRELSNKQLADSERAIAMRTVQDEAEKTTKAYQDSLTAISAAGAQKRLAQELAALEQRKSAVEKEHAQGVLSEANYVAQIAAIDIARLRAQGAAVQAQLAAERGKLVKGGDSQEQNATKARVLQLEAQAIQITASIGAAVAKEANDATKTQLDRAREQAQAYAAIWQSAATQIRQFSQSVADTQARLLADPAARAQAAGDAATAEMRRQKEELERDLVNQIGVESSNPARQAQAAELQRQLDELRAKSALAIAEATRAAQFAELTAMASEAQSRLQAAEQAVALQVDAGNITAAEGERQILALRQAQIPELERILALMQAIAASAADKQQLADLTNRKTQLADMRTELERIAKNQAVGGLADALTDIETGAATAKQALMGMVAGFARAMLDVLNRRLAEQLVNQFINAANSGGFGGFVAGLFGSGGGAAEAAVSTWAYHTGGIAGAGGTMRAVNPLLFALAPRYHSGGIGGLLPDEVPAILRKGEEVLRANDPRHRNNNASMGGVSISNNVTINGASGDAASQRDAIDDLTRNQEAAFQAWAIKQMRPGGLWGRR